jgi:hypothetical protein
MEVRGTIRCWSAPHLDEDGARRETRAWRTRAWTGPLEPEDTAGCAAQESMVVQIVVY